MSPSPSLPSSLRTTSRPRSSRRPVSVAVTGGIGAGKSELLHAFERQGAAVVSSDDIVHILLRQDPDVKRAVVERLGEEVLGPDGEIDRGAVARIVFSSRRQLKWLEELLHPLVVATYLRWREQLGELDEPPEVCITEVPLLYEVGGETRFDKVVAVTASPDVRAARKVLVTDRREGRLIPDEEKLQRADFAYVNNGSREELDAFAADVMARLTP
jgi:dephospho-CoA kinase